MQELSLKNRLLLMASLLVGAMSHAYAADQQGVASNSPKGLSTTYVTCQKQARGAVEHAACVSQEETVQDRRLNRTYKELLESLNADSRTKLVDAQRAWLQSRTKDGNLEAAIYGDSQAENIESAEAAMLRLTARADQLEKYLALIN
ncbi:lysozyme inhibitor LprI family protein [Xanthomonas campestris]|uniref:lysozyme inhibitor LprI family protein n=1 Tax=Xanthomonas campestris TaxID=339 RepID=UPI001E4B854D|nr:lysozyme inhibitor LprI family protein [Xanthomonas campestris]MCC4605870.1 lysozyme inhibitor LprI family protein [Xanthomonas campestris pv. parthenii]